MKKTRKLAPYFLTTGSYSDDERHDLCKKINRLGGVLLDVKVGLASCLYETQQQLNVQVCVHD
jgi:hypothetical protein